jgi:hypothetical protein
MEREYGTAKGEKVFYASKNKGTISGIDAQEDCITPYMAACGRGDSAGISDACIRMTHAHERLMKGK